MKKNRRSNLQATPTSREIPGSQAQSSRRRPGPSLPSSGYGIPPRTKEINAAPMLQRAQPGIDSNAPMTASRAIAMAGIAIHDALPVLLAWGMTMSLIFGGCCSNVFALEAIVKEEPENGLLITFTQFLVTTLFTWPTHFSSSNPPFFLKRPAVPTLRWLPNVVLFFTVNMLNNFAFGYNISVPVHIILRSGGSVTTILVGWIWGKRYTPMQVFSVAILTVGVIVAAMSDARSKGKMSTLSIDTPTASFVQGLLILLVAQILSAIMGLYTEMTYEQYGKHWNENLFYSHFLSIPLFLPFIPSLSDRFSRILASQPFPIDLLPWLTRSPNSGSWFESFRLSPVKRANQMPPGYIELPTQALLLALNALTQYACIRGVNLLGARTSALGVTIVLNVRKLVSLFASIWLFGNTLPTGVTVGAGVVFLGGGVYAWESGRKKDWQVENGKMKR